MEQELIEESKNKLEEDITIAELSKALQKWIIIKVLDMMAFVSSFISYIGTTLNMISMK